MSTSSDSLDHEETAGEVRPVAVSGGRLVSLDFIRGIAVMGILAANIHALGQPMTASSYPGAFAVDHSSAEDWMWAAQLVLVDGKMRGLFALLFGAGLYLFMEKAWAKGASRLLQVRRLGWLAVFGLLHFYFVWQGDVLFAYAISGMVITATFLYLSARAQFVLGLLGHVAGAGFFMISLGFMQSVVDGPEPDKVGLIEARASFIEAAEADLADDRAEIAIRQEGSYGDYLAHIFDEHSADPLWGIISLPFEVIPFMLIGMGLYRMGIFDGSFDRGRQVRWGWSMLLAGALVTGIIAIWTVAEGLTYYGSAAAAAGWTHLPRVAMTLGLAFLLAAYAPQAGGWLSSRVSAAGRAAFSNYLGTSLVFLPVFSSWGLDLFGRLGRSELYLLVLAGWAVMILWSKPWLDRFNYGPLEWLWRCLTYGKLFALRR